MELKDLNEDSLLIMECSKKATGANTHSVNSWLHKYRANLNTIRRKIEDPELPRLSKQKEKQLFKRAKITEKNLRIFLRTGKIPEL